MILAWILSWGHVDHVQVLAENTFFLHAHGLIESICDYLQLGPLLWHTGLL